MFCDQCGTAITETQAYCPSCGKAVKAAAPVRYAAPAPPGSRVASHIHGLGVLWLAYAAISMLSYWVFSSFLPRFLENWGWWGGMNFPFFAGILRFAGFLLLLRGIAGLIIGWGLIERQPWARIGAIVLGVLTLFRLPFGTALGIYTLWVLLPADSEREYRQIARTV